MPHVIAYYDNQEQVLSGKIELKVPLHILQQMFSPDEDEYDPKLYDCYTLEKKHDAFILKYLTDELIIDREKYSYFLEYYE